MQSKPSKRILDQFSAHVKSDSVFSANARLLQSLWRDANGYPFEKYGNQFLVDFAKSSKANYLTPTIAKLVEEEVNNAGDRVISEPRIWNNLLSSQPLAFNLFGELKLEPGFKTMQGVLNELYPGRSAQVTSLEFEYSPSRKSEKYTNDRSAFDVFIEYLNPEGEKCFFGVEVKYSENMNDAPARVRDEYGQVALEMGIFKPECFDELKNTSIQQLWRDHLLAGSMFIKNQDYDRGDFIILYPQDNTNCVRSIEKYQKTFNTDDNYFIPLTIERFHTALSKVSNEKWVSDFYDRYLDFEKLKELG